MLAVVEISKKQYLVQEGDSLQIERLKEKEGKIIFDKVLLLADDKKVNVGNPYVEKATVEALVEGEKKDKKIIVYKFKRRKKYRKKQGHRQIHTNLKIVRISVSSAQTPSE
ncbi:MAG: 50S ribosomal protein L21 [Candidatus Omnitrophota bacterium]